MTTLVSLLTIGACYRVGVRYPEWRVSVWIVFFVAVASAVAEWAGR